MTVVQQSHKDIGAEQGEETAEHSHRRHALEDRALLLGVIEPLLVQLDAVIAEIQERESQVYIHAYA